MRTYELHNNRVEIVNNNGMFSLFSTTSTPQPFYQPLVGGW